MTDIDVPDTDQDDTAEPSSDRRGLLTKLAIGGAGAAVGAVALGRTVSAADNDPLRLGGDAMGQDANNESGTRTIQRCNHGTAPKEDAPSGFSVVSEDRDIGGFPFPAALGGYGHEGYVNGVHGSTDQRAGLGAVAANVYDVDATDTEDAPVALAAQCLKGPQLRLVPNEEFVGPFPGIARVGQLFNDAAGTLWCVVPVDQEDFSAGVKFTRICGTPTAGALTLLATPQRCADTRIGVPGPRLGLNGTITVDLKRTIEGADTGVVADATAAEITMTVTNTSERGFFFAYADGESPPPGGFSNGNWVGDNLSVASNFITRISDGFLIAGIGGFGTCDVLIDVTGFYR